MAIEKCVKCGNLCNEYVPLPIVGKFICVPCAKREMEAKA